ncbi:hypothetical protein XBFM1_1030001 [Xenorhabdus bovienii str. feltiae Moldova]|uniref:Uncharacterized protein n=1 Tax=Xenorhabdus bovienii str. feltiae Moldova TaxID=1398200 RepID=A0A077NPE7_XENBV|nr:hypothetical protein XBFM1_1030001 [Xenorhabdus bovienii str. feltiae Moldova]
MDKIKRLAKWDLKAHFKWDTHFGFIHTGEGVRNFSHTLCFRVLGT